MIKISRSKYLELVEKGQDKNVKRTKNGYYKMKYRTKEEKKELYSK